MAVVTIRDVPEQVRDLLAAQARARGQSMQSYLLGVLRQQADFSYNSQVVFEIEEDLLHHGGLRPGSPTPAELIAEEREERDRRLAER